MRFYEVCINYYNQQQKRVNVGFLHTEPKMDLSELIQRIDDICKGTHVNFVYQFSHSKENYSCKQEYRFSIDF